MPSPKSKEGHGQISSSAQANLARQSQRLNTALFIGGAVGLGFFVYTYLIKHINPVPIVGQNSITNPLFFVAAGMVFVLFWIVFNRTKNRLISPSRFGLIFNSTVLSLATTLIGGAIILTFVAGMNSAFRGLSLDIVTASIIAASAVAAVAYWTIDFAASMTIQRIYTMLTIILFGGILLSAITVSNSAWYDIYLSALGMADAGQSAVLFNFSLIFAGIMLIAMAEVLFRCVRNFYIHNPRVGRMRYNILYGLFVVAGLLLAGIGWWPYVENTTQGTLHQLSAGLLGALFVLWMVGLRWLIPFFERSFYVFSALLGLSIVVIFVLASARIYFNVTGEELAVFAIATVWLSLFLSNMLRAAGGDGLA